MTAPVGGDGLADLVFPDGFVWGVGCSAHQVEGGSDDSWSTWEDTGRVAQSAGDACGWWTDAERDFDHARTMGLNALRLSTAWSRIEPEPGRFDDTALARYSEMVDGLVARGIEPWVCLHHLARFAAYAARVVDALGDRVIRWLTFNEPNVYIVQGYLNGAYPPGRNARFVAATRLLGSMARCHAAAYESIHHRVAGAEVSWAQHQIIFDPASPARRADRAVAAVQRRSFNEAFSDIIIHGRAPQALGWLTGDLSAAAGTFDYLGINLYGRWQVAFDPRAANEGFGRRTIPEGVPTGDGGLQALHGALETCHALIAEGIDLRGYFHWTLVDNFEWDHGWNSRFGLLELDRNTQQRTIRPSGHLYTRTANANTLTGADRVTFGHPPAPIASATVT